MRNALLICAALAAPAWADQLEWRAPFITTPPQVVERMLELAGTRPDDVVIDLGSGDGRIVIAAAQKFGARALGIELDRALVQKSRANALSANVAQRATFVEGDVLAADISGASVVTVYLLPGLMEKLQARFIGELAPGTRIVSHEFTMAGWLPDRSETVRLKARHSGQGDESRLHLWIVPAQVRGTWRATGSETGITLRIEQSYQRIEVEGARAATLSGRDISWDNFKGRVEGSRIVGELGGRPIVLTR
jgi:hypothetical protein